MLGQQIGFDEWIGDVQEAIITRKTHEIEAAMKEEKLVLEELRRLGVRIEIEEV